MLESFDKDLKAAFLKRFKNQLQILLRQMKKKIEHLSKDTEVTTKHEMM